MSKAALDQFTRSLALDLAPKQVRVNGVRLVYLQYKCILLYKLIKIFMMICDMLICKYDIIYMMCGLNHIVTQQIF